MAGSRGGKRGGGRGGGGQNQQKCHICQKTGHIAKNCPTTQKKGNQKNQNNQKCTYCGKTNHKSEACKFKTGTKNNTTKGGNITRVCTKCQGWHLDKDCNAPGNGLGTDGKPLNCKLCGGPHYNNACPKKIGPANWADNTTNSNNTDNTTNNTNPYLNTNGPGGIHQNTWNDSKFLYQDCAICGKAHLIDDCPQAQYLAPGQHKDAAIPPMPAVVFDKNQGQWIMPPQPPPVNPTFPYQGFGLAPPQAAAAKYQDDADNLYAPTNIYGTAGISAFAAHSLGRNGNEFHKDSFGDRDGDIEMEDVDGCDGCEFDPLDRVEMMRQRDVQREIENLRYQQEMQELARVGDVRGFGWGWKYP